MTISEARGVTTRLSALRASLDRHPHAALLAILVVGLLVRLYLLGGAGMMIDQSLYHDWAVCAADNGIFGLYRCPNPANYPPLIPTLHGILLTIYRAGGGDMAWSESSAALIATLKLPALLFELALVALAFRIARAKAGAGGALLVAAALYWNPGFLVITAWWGQTDAIYTFFLLLTGYLLVERRPRAMWFVFGVAMLTKFQSIMLLPALGILSLRRFGWRATAIGGILFALTFAVGELPFFLANGERALSPYRGSVNQFPYISNGAHNFWFWVSGSSPTVLLDSLPLVGGITYFQAGLVLLVVGTAVVCWRAWAGARRDDEYLLLAVANFSFYMLPTQIQSRYLYPGLVFLALAMIRDWRLILLFVVASLAFAHNIFAGVWLGTGLLFYPSKLLFWQPVHDGLALTVVYVMLMAIFLQPLLRRDRARLASEV